MRNEGREFNCPFPNFGGEGIPKWGTQIWLCSQLLCWPCSGSSWFPNEIVDISWFIWDWEMELEQFPGMGKNGMDQGLNYSPPVSGNKGISRWLRYDPSHGRAWECSFLWILESFSPGKRKSPLSWRDFLSLQENIFNIFNVLRTLSKGWLELLSFPRAFQWIFHNQ